MFPLYDEGHFFHKTPVVTIGLIFLNTIIFLFTFPHLEETIKTFGMIPANILAGQRIGTLFSSMFLHGGFFHLIGNMWFLWIFGDNLEHAMGRIRFLVFYLSCGLIANFSYCFLTSNINIPTIGASGAVSGVLGGYLVLYPRNRIRTLVPLGFFLTTVSIPVIVFLFIWFVYQFLLPDERIATSAHIVGFLVGVLLVKFFQRR